MIFVSEIFLHQHLFIYDIFRMYFHFLDVVYTPYIVSYKYNI
jgi:hypothetical protein